MPPSPSRPVSATSSRRQDRSTREDKYSERPRSRSRDRDRDRRGRRDKESGRERDKDQYRERDRDRDRNRDRHRDHERDRDRIRDKGRDRDGERESKRRRREASSRSRSPPRRSKVPLPPQSALAPPESSRHPRSRPDPAHASAAGDGPPLEKQRPNFAQTGLLAAETNTLNGTVLKYAEPIEARLPPKNVRYKLFVFKNDDIIDTVELNGRSCWLVGRDRAVADLPVDHPSCSKQHAVLQFRHVVKTGEFGDRVGKVGLYLLDLESANGTELNKVKLEARRYVEMREGDLVKFGESTREYVLMMDRD